MLWLNQIGNYGRHGDGRGSAWVGIIVGIVVILGLIWVQVATEPARGLPTFNQFVLAPHVGFPRHPDDMTGRQWDAFCLHVTQSGEGARALGARWSQWPAKYLGAMMACIVQEGMEHDDE